MLGVTVRWGQVLGTSKKAGNWGGAGGMAWMCVGRGHLANVKVKLSILCQTAVSVMKPYRELMNFALLS